MKKISYFFLILAISFLMIPGCKKKIESLSPHSHPVVQGDTVKVNNQICAVSGSMIREEDMGKFENQVEYTGENKKFKGRKFVFNQCCEMCIKQFPNMWNENQDQILMQHGLE